MLDAPLLEHKKAIVMGGLWYRCLLMLCVFCVVVFTVQPCMGSFSRVINLPRENDNAPEDFTFIGSDTQLNVRDGALVVDFFDAGKPNGTSSNIEVNVLLGGTVGDFFDANGGSTINVAGGIVGDEFDAYNNSRLNVSAGRLGNNADAIPGSTVEVSGGAVGNNFTAHSYTEVSVTGGSVGEFFQMFPNSTLEVTGGAIGDRFRASTAMVDIRGGSFGEAFEVRQRSVVTIAGGTFAERFTATSSSQIHFFGTSFQLDGVDLRPSLKPHVPFPITIRDVPLSGILADGSPFQFDLNSQASLNADHFSPFTTITVTLIIPEPAGGLLLAVLVLCVASFRRDRFLGA